MASYQRVATSAAQLCDQYSDKGDDLTLRYTHQAYLDTVMKVTHYIFVQFPHS